MSGAHHTLPDIFFETFEVDGREAIYSDSQFLWQSMAYLPFPVTLLSVGGLYRLWKRHDKWWL